VTALENRRIQVRSPSSSVTYSAPIVKLCGRCARVVGHLRSLSKRPAVLEVGSDPPLRSQNAFSPDGTPKRRRIRIGSDACHVPATEVRGEQGRAVEGDVRRMGEQMRRRILDIDLRRAAIRRDA
jgi:hypothetical protein